MESKHLLRALVLTLVFVVGCAIDVVEVTQYNFQVISKEKKTLFMYATKPDCVECKLKYRHFVIAAQNFKHDPDIRFGTVSDETLLEVFDVADVPALVFYEFGSAMPRVYRGDITATALIKLMAQGAKVDFKKIDKTHVLELTRENFNEFIGNEDQYRWVMLHEEDDEDDVESFEELAETYENELNVVIARLNVDKEWKLKREFYAGNYPTFYWYPKGTVEKKKRYGGAFNINQIINFINKEANLFRTKGGRLNPYAGLIKQLNEVIGKFGKELYEIKKLDKIRNKLKSEIARLPADTDQELVDYYLHLLDEMEEDRTIESLDEARNRLYRQMDSVGPLQFDQLIRKRNIVQKFIDVIGDHLLKNLSGEAFSMPQEDGFREGSTQPLKFYDEF